MPLRTMHSNPTSFRTRLFHCALLGLILALSTCGPGGGPPTTAKTTPKIAAQHIKHIIFFIKENRTFDNYFGTYPGADGATSAMDSLGKMVPLHHERDQVPDINHSSTSARLAYDNGKMDRFDLIKQNKATAKNASGSSTLNPYANNSLTQLYQSDIPNYWTYAQNFVMGD